MTIYKNFSDETLLHTFGLRWRDRSPLLLVRAHDTSASTCSSPRIDGDRIETSHPRPERCIRPSTRCCGTSTSLDETRPELQSRRVRSDTNSFALFGDPLGRAGWGGGNQETRETLVRAFGIDELFQPSAGAPGDEPVNATEAPRN